MIQDYETLYLDNFIERTAQSLGKPIAYLRSYGWNNSTDIEKINESMEVYKELLPIDIYNALHDSEFVFLILEDINEAVEFFEENFPESQSDCDKEFYVHYTVVNELGQTIVSN